MLRWVIENSSTITIWCAALCTFAIYSVLYTENRFYRLFEHIFIGVGMGYSAYVTWSQVLKPMWWDPMVQQGQWYWAFALVLGSMFYFMYSRKHAWVSRIIFGLFMGLVAGGIFKEFYEIYFPQIGASMKPLAGRGMTGWDTVGAIVFYVILFASMSYFFFSFEHKNVVAKKSASLGRWFLMIGFGAIFGATVMGRMSLFIGRFNFLVNDWAPQVHNAWVGSNIFKVVAVLAVAGAAYAIASAIRKERKQKKVTQE